MSLSLYDLNNDKASKQIATTISDGLISKEDKAKLDTIENGANNYTHPATHSTSMITGLSSVATSGNYNDLINKPTIPTSLPANGGDSDTVDGKHATDFTPASHIGSNGAVHAAATQSTAGFISATDKMKLDGVASSATLVADSATNGNIKINGVETIVYTHPATHAATMIIEDASNRFVTDTQISNWDAKLDATANAVSATKLATARTINGVNFDGSANITLPNATTSIAGLMSTTDKTKLDAINQALATSSSPTFADLKAASLSTSLTWEKTFYQSFASAPNQKIDMYWTGETYGTIEVEITGGYNYGNAIGKILKRFAFGGSATGSAWTNTVEKTEVVGTIKDNFGIGDISWDSTNSRWKFTIAQRSGQNVISIRIKILASKPDHLTAWKTMAMSAIYTTDTTDIVNVSGLWNNGDLTTTANISCNSTTLGASIKETTYMVEPTAVANQKIDLYFPANTAVSQNMIIQVYREGNYYGVLRKELSFYGTSVGAVGSYAILKTESSGNLNSYFGIGDVSWDSTKSRWKITIAMRSSIAMSFKIYVKMTGANAQLPALSSVYTTDTTDIVNVSGLYNNGQLTTTGNVGIGTTSPTLKLHVNTTTFENESGVSTPNGALCISAISDTSRILTAGVGLDHTWIQSRTSNSATFNSPLVLNPSGGNVGIGTTLPLFTLQISKTYTDKPLQGIGQYLTNVTNTTGTYNGYGYYLDASAMSIAAGISNTGAYRGAYISVVPSTTEFAGTLNGQMGVDTVTGINNATSGASITTSYGFKNMICRAIAGTTITNAYGLYLSSSGTATTVTNWWDIYAGNASAKSYFAGNVGIGTDITKTWHTGYKVLQLGGKSNLYAHNNTTSAHLILANNVYNNASDTSMYMTTNAATRYIQNNDGLHKFQVAQSGTVDTAIAFTDALILANNGAATFANTVNATTFVGALTGNASTATKLQTARTINGVAFDGTANITVADATKLPLVGGTLSGNLTLNNTAINIMRNAAETGEWARGIQLINPSSVVEAGIGFFGNANTAPSYIYMGLDSTPWSSNGLQIYSSTLTFNSNTIYHAGNFTPNTDTSTTSQTFQLQSGSSGAKLKNNAGVLEVRNAADSAYANLIVNNLTVSGTTFTVNSETVLMNDNTIVLNNNYVGSAPTENGGIEIERGTLGNASLIWDESSDTWKAGLAGSESLIYTAGNYTSIPTATTSTAGLLNAVDKTKLDSLSPYVHPSSHLATMIVEDTLHRFVTDVEKTKLSGIEANANNYTHPANHSPSIITQDVNNRFVTDAQISTWNDKLDKTGGTVTGNLTVQGTLTTNYGSPIEIGQFIDFHRSGSTVDNDGRLWLGNSGDSNLYWSSAAGTGPVVVANGVAITNQTVFTCAANTSIGQENGGNGYLEVRGNGGAAYMQFHRPGQFAAFFGIDGNNEFKVGGWSMGDVAYTIYHSGNIPGIASASSTLAVKRTMVSTSTPSGGIDGDIWIQY